MRTDETIALQKKKESESHEKNLLLVGIPNGLWQRLWGIPGQKRGPMEHAERATRSVEFRLE